MKLTTKVPAADVPDNGILACVLAPDKSTYFTWYRSGNVVRTENGVSEQAGRAWTIEGFNALLEGVGVVGLQGRDALKSKRPERLAP